jgi:hypothetical protein
MKSPVEFEGVLGLASIRSLAIAPHGQTSLSVAPGLDKQVCPWHPVSTNRFVRDTEHKTNSRTASNKFVRGTEDENNSWAVSHKRVCQNSLMEADNAITGGIE